MKKSDNMDKLIELINKDESRTFLKMFIKKHNKRLVRNDVIFAWKKRIRKDKGNGKCPHNKSGKDSEDLQWSFVDSSTKLNSFSLKK